MLPKTSRRRKIATALQTAQQQGLTRYMGKVCPRGHSGERWVQNRGCVECSNERTRTWQADNKEQYLAVASKWRMANLIKCRAYNWSNYGAPMPSRPEPDLCECCGNPETHAKNKNLQLDHDHDTGVFRGWLCWNCNTSIGKLGDNLDGVKKAVAYLERVQQ